MFLMRKNMIRFNEFGGTIHERPVQDLAFAVARFVRTGGSFINYYMVSLSNFSSHHGLIFCIICCNLNEIYQTVPWRHQLWAHCRRSVHHNQLRLWCPDWWIWYVTVVPNYFHIFVGTYLDEYCNLRFGSRAQVWSSQGASQGYQALWARACLVWP